MDLRPAVRESGGGWQGASEKLIGFLAKMLVLSHAAHALSERDSIAPLID
jgi:hypothetical protein